MSGKNYTEQIQSLVGEFKFWIKKFKTTGILLHQQQNAPLFFTYMQKSRFTHYLWFLYQEQADQFGSICLYTPNTGFLMMRLGGLGFLNVRFASAFNISFFLFHFR